MIKRYPSRRLGGKPKPYSKARANAGPNESNELSTGSHREEWKRRERLELLKFYFESINKNSTLWNIYCILRGKIEPHNIGNIDK